MSGSGTTASGTCTRCGKSLAGRQIGGVDLAACDACSTLLVKQSALMPALEALSAPVLESFDADARLQALPDRTGGAPCPGCTRDMEKADYCGANLVYFDRCTRCGLLWIGSEELGAMSLMWARMEKRIARARAHTEESLAGMNARLDAQHLRRVVETSMRVVSLVR